MMTYDILHVTGTSGPCKNADGLTSRALIILRDHRP